MFSGPKGLLFDPSHDVVSAALSVLSSMTSSCPQLVTVEVVRQLILILTRSTKKDAQTVRRCESNLQCLRNVCRFREIQELAIKAGVVEAVSRFLSTALA